MTGPAFSYDIFVAQQAGGVTRCMLEVMRELAGDWRLWSPFAPNRLLAKAAVEPWLDSRWHRARARRGGRILASLQLEPAFARWLRHAGSPVVHRTYYPIIDLAPGRCRRVVTLHDMWDERSEVARDRGARVRSRIKRRACERADRIICVSEHTRQEMMTFWPWAAEKTVVIPHGVRPLAQDVPPIDRHRSFFLFVGRRGSYKNFAVAVEALAGADLAEHGLVCFGGGPLTHEERDIIRQRGLNGRVVQLDGTDAELVGYYEAAAALLYPSSYEGFGLPLLEAMIHGCPVIASPLTALPEVGGEAVLFANPDDGSAWVEALRTVVLDPAAAARLRAAGRERAGLFSWRRSAEAHQRIYDELM